MSDSTNLPSVLKDLSIEELESPLDRLDEISRHCKDEFIKSEDPRDKERAFRMYMVTHTVMAADEGASEEALVRNFLLSKPGLMSILAEPKAMQNLYAAFEKHLTLHSAHHLILSPEGFVSQLKRIAQKANKTLSRYSSRPEYLKKKK